MLVLNAFGSVRCGHRHYAKPLQQGKILPKGTAALTLCLAGPQADAAGVAEEARATSAAVLAYVAALATRGELADAIIAGRADATGAPPPPEPAHDSPTFRHGMQVPAPVALQVNPS